MSRRPLWFLAAPVLVLAGCSATPGPTVATADQPSASAFASPSATAPRTETDYDKALRYTRCMSDNGYLMADPVEGQILLTYNTFSGAADDAARLAAGFAAHPKCKQYLPASWPIKMDAKEIARSRAYVECMRQRGIDEPVPDANGMVREPTNDDWRQTPEYTAGVAKCRHLVDDAANDQPENR